MLVGRRATDTGDRLRLDARHGIGVAVIDSGIEPGTDFDNRITAFYDFTNGDIRAVTPH